MKYKTIQKEVDFYVCGVCENEFPVGNKRYPYFCYECHKEDTFYQDIHTINELHQWCHICNEFFKISEYLIDIFKYNERARWLANMVTHYRHAHLKSWDKAWSRNGYGSKFLSEGTYESEKAKVNERAKRQILRTCKDYLREHGFTVEDVLMLQNTDQKTVDLYGKILGYSNVHCKK